MSIRIFQYGEGQITFRQDNGLFVNATEMAKSFGKKPAEWSRNNQAQEYMSELAKVRNCTLGDLIKTSQGGNAAGTWMHEDVAMEFARWLSPAFAIWCNDRIKELMQHGVTATPAKLEEMLADPDTLITTLQALKSARETAAAERAARLRTEESLQLANETIEKQAPAVLYHNRVLQSASLLTTNMIAADLGVSVHTLYRKLVDDKVVYKQSGTYMLTAPYRSKGLADYGVYAYKDSEGVEKTRQQFYWTEAGRKFIIERYANR